MERMTAVEMQRFLVAEIERGTDELEALRGLMYILGVKIPRPSKEELED
jgi:hypothetical protein